MASPKRSKSWGYEVEVAALKALLPIFPGLRRTGSVAYKKAAADLIQEGLDGSDWITLRLVVTRDKRRPLLVTMSADDLVKLRHLVNPGFARVVVQCKGRESTWIGRLYDELKKATS